MNVTAVNKAEEGDDNSGILQGRREREREIEREREREIFSLNMYDVFG